MDAAAYREATRAASSARGAASTSGGLIGKLAFEGASDVALGARRKEGDERDGEEGGRESGRRRGRRRRRIKS